MTSEDGRWDPATVVGLRSSDQVLVIGNPAMMPWIGPIFENREDNLLSARRPTELEALLRDGRRFDKMILSRETQFSHDHLLRAAAFGAQLVFFPQSEGAAWQVEQSLDFYYPGARMWKLDSTFGPVLVAEPQGCSWRMIFDD